MPCALAGGCQMEFVAGFHLAEFWQQSLDFKKEYAGLPFSDVRNAFVWAVLRLLVSLCEFQLKKEKSKQ